MTVRHKLLSFLAILLTACSGELQKLEPGLRAVHADQVVRAPLSPALMAGEIAYTEYWLYVTGEAYQKDRFIAPQLGAPEVYYNPNINVVTGQLKFAAMREAAPEIIAVGNSRVNQFRAGMFAPYKFYNMGNLTTSLPAIVSMMDALPEEDRPKFVITIIEPFMLRDGEGYDPTDPGKWLDWPIERPQTWTDAWRRWSRGDDFAWVRAEGAGTLWLGGRAIDSGRGTRGSDGSVYWGRHHDRSPAQHENVLSTYESRAQRLMDAKTMFDGFEGGIDPGVYGRLERYSREMADRGVTVIGVTPPLGAAVQARLDGDPARYAVWHEMQRPEFAARLNRIFPYFNYARHESFGGTPDMVMDAIHPSEVAAAMMILAMREDPRIAALWPELDLSDLRRRVDARETPVQALYD